jgi:hypothetical protein
MREPVIATLIAVVASTDTRPLRMGEAQTQQASYRAGLVCRLLPPLSAETGMLRS